MWSYETGAPYAVDYRICRTDAYREAAIKSYDATAVGPMGGVDDGSTGFCRIIYTPPAPPTC
jgi:hypothetical protein